MSEVYVGRMVADGNGNLLADEGERAGDPIAYDADTDTYVFLAPGEPSHNERHHQQVAGLTPTQNKDPEQPGYAGTEEEPTEGNDHHFIDPQDRPTPSVLPDNVAVKASGHTDQHKLGEE